MFALARGLGNFQVRYTVVITEDVNFLNHSPAGEFPFAVKEELITRTIESWSNPVQEIFARAERVFVERLTKLVDQHFGEHAYGGLRSAVM